jgi:hypothetical protein
MPTAVGTGKRRKRDSFESYRSIGYFPPRLEESDAHLRKPARNGGFTSTAKNPEGVGLSQELNTWHLEDAKRRCDLKSRRNHRDAQTLCLGDVRLGA